MAVIKPMERAYLVVMAGMETSVICFVLLTAWTQHVTRIRVNVMAVEMGGKG